MINDAVIHLKKRQDSIERLRSNDFIELDRAFRFLRNGKNGDRLYPTNNKHVASDVNPSFACFVYLRT